MKRKRFTIKQIWKYIVAVLLSFVYLIPIYILIGVAFKSPADLSSRWQMPGYLYLDNFKNALNRGNMLLAFRNSGIITVLTVTGATLLGGLAAYPLARNQSTLNKCIRSVLIGIMIVPPLSILVPLYSTMVKLHGISNYWGIVTILITFALPTSCFLITNFISSIPITLDEAAAIDGCSPFQTYFRIIIPQLKPILSTVVLLTSVSTWNDYQFSLYLLQSPKYKTITTTIAGFFSQSLTDLNGAAAAALLAVLPVILLFIFFQRYFISGLMDGALK